MIAVPIRTNLAVLLAGALATACGQAGDAGAATSGIAGAAALQPGLYRIVQTGDVEIEEEKCMAAGDIAAGRWPVEGAIEPGWTVEQNSLSGGRIIVRARHPRGARIEITGTYQARSFAVEATLDMPVNGAPHRVRTVQRGTFLSPDCEE